jgi:hypothetical protein
MTVWVLLICFRGMTVDQCVAGGDLRLYATREQCEADPRPPGIAVVPCRERRAAAPASLLAPLPPEKK